MNKKIENTDVSMEEALAGQIPEYNETETVTNNDEFDDPAKYIGKTLRYKSAQEEEREEAREFARKNHVSKVGDVIGQNAEIRNGWIPIDRELLGERNVFYPEDWTFYVRPATVEVVRNWSILDEENPNSIDDVFNEIIKNCLSIKTNLGPVPYTMINSWDRFFFVLLIREYTFIKGDGMIQFGEDCANCDNPITFTLTSQSLMYDVPDSEVMKYYDPSDRSWHIDPEEYGIEGKDAIVLYIPTIEKDMNIKSWMINRANENRNVKIDPVFVKFLQWLAPKISKDDTIAKKQIREYEIKFKTWDIEMFSFMDDVLNNITVTPASTLKTTCPACGEEVTTPIRFQNGIKSLFNMDSGHKKFGKK